MSDKGKLLTAAAPKSGCVDWVGIPFGIISCVKAFSTQSTCKLAFCPSCFEIRTDTDKVIRTKKTRVTRKRGESAAKATGEEMEEKCRHHTVPYVINLIFMGDLSYLKLRRNSQLKGHENIAETCYDWCIIF